MAYQGIFRAIYRFHPPLRHCSSTSGGHYDVVVAGGGIMGCASAYFLSQRLSPSSICIVERDPRYEKASTVLSVASIRQQFSLPANILMSLHSVDFLHNISTHLRVDGEDPPDIQFQEKGYLFLASPEGEQTLRENYLLQRSLGAEVELVEPPRLREIFPWINTEGVKLACLGVKNEGWFDPWLLLNAFRKKLRSLGVKFLAGNVSGVTVKDKRVRKVKVAKLKTEVEEELSCDFLINATGAWAGEFARLAGIGDPKQDDPVLRVPLPVTPRRRCVFVFKCPIFKESSRSSPLVIDYSGAYFRRESSGNPTFIVGMAPPEHLDRDDEELTVDHSLFYERIWPVIANRVPAFENLKVQGSWAGYYEYNTFDQNGIIGAHPVIPNLIFANGFSGHGIQQAPAVGVAVSEIVLDGRTSTIDLSQFSFDRIIQNRPLREKNII